MPSEKEPGSDFDAFVKSQQAAKEEPWDTKKELQQWLDYLDQLYGLVDEYLKKYVDAGEIEIQHGQVSLTEEYVGTYEAPERRLILGKNSIRLTPLGTFIIGAKGRVDLVGPRATVWLILVDKELKGPKISVTISVGGKPPPSPPPKTNIDWTWKIVARGAGLQYLELTQDSLFEAIKAVTNG